MIVIGSDHRGFHLKEEIKTYLESKKLKYKDLGNKEYDKKDDYPKFALKVAEYVSGHKSKGILICGTGIGMSIAANKVKGVRAAVIRSLNQAKVTREHNNANVICLSGSTETSHAKRLVSIFMDSKFKGGRHRRRLQQIKMIEELQKRV